MRIVLLGVLTFLCSIQLNARWGNPSTVQFVFYRIEQAFRTGEPASVEDLIPSGIQMRIEDSLYQSITGSEAVNRLKEFFANKDSIDFRFGIQGQGTLTYVMGGKRDSIQVDVWLKRKRGEISIQALNISNYPIATVFFNTPRGKTSTAK